jgi:hypothetical protein
VFNLLCSSTSSESKSTQVPCKPETLSRSWSIDHLSNLFTWIALFQETTKKHRIIFFFSTNYDTSRKHSHELPLLGTLVFIYPYNKVQAKRQCLDKASVLEIPRNKQSSQWTQVVGKSACQRQLKSRRSKVSRKDSKSKASYSSINPFSMDY